MQVNTERVSFLRDNETGVAYQYKEAETTTRMWNDNIGGGIILPRNYHKKIYNGKRICDIGMSQPDLLKTYILSEHIAKNTNIIGKKKSSAYGNARDVSEILGISEKSAKEYLSRMIKIRVLAKMSLQIGLSAITCYAFNPIYVNSCKYVSPMIYNEFWEDMDKIMPEWMIDKYSASLSDRGIKSKKEQARKEQIENGKSGEIPK